MSPAREPSDITRLLHASREGDREATDRLIEAVYPELQRMARIALGGSRHGHTLQPTALLHEAYLKLAASDREWQDRTHFFAVFATALRQILVDHARGKSAQKRGGGVPHAVFDEAIGYTDGQPEILLHLDEAIGRLAAIDERKARILELRYFGGLTLDETAEAVGVSVATVGREARFAEAWLKKELAG